MAVLLFPSCPKIVPCCDVDDFEMFGPEENLDKGWSLILKGLDIEPPVPIGVYFGCSHKEGTMKIGDITARTMT